MNHTPGQLRVVFPEIQATDPRATIVCTVTGAASNPQAVANAELLARAPFAPHECWDAGCPGKRLLILLRELASCYDEGNFDGYFIEQARAILAKLDAAHPQQK